MKTSATVQLIRKEKPLPPAKPPARPPAPTGIRAPGGAGASTGMVCPGPGR
jgi:hypothetical protein